MAVLLACYFITPGRTLQKFNISKSFPAEEIELMDISGNRVKLSDHRGFPVILYMWNSSYPYPAEFLVAIENIYKATKNPTVSFIALDRSNNAAKLCQFIDANKTDYPIYTAAAYALLVSVDLPEQLTNNKQIFDTSRIAWPRLRESFIDAVSLHPDSLRLLNKAALYASMMNDREIAKSAFAGIGDNYDPHI